MLELKDPVKMIGLETKGMNARAKLSHHLFETIQHEQIIVVTMEKRFSMVAAVQAMVKSAREINPRFASQGEPA